MPLLDVSSLLLDPDFCTTFDVIRTAQADPVGGLAVLTPTTIPTIVGVVEPATTQDLLRLPDADRLAGGIAIYTTYRLTTGGGGYTADQVTWNGRTYTVMQVDDWTQFGAGYVKATATAQTIGD